MDREHNAFNKAENNKTFGSEPELLLSSVERCSTYSATCGFKSSGNSEIANRNLEESDISSVYERATGGNLQNSSPGNSFSGVCQNTVTPVPPKEIVLDSRPRKRPRKSTPRKIDQGWQNKCLVAHVSEFNRNECASETDTASETDSASQPVLPLDNAVLLQSPGEESQESSLKADPSGGPKVLFKRTEGNNCVTAIHLLMSG